MTQVSFLLLIALTLLQSWAGASAMDSFTQQHHDSHYAARDAHEQYQQSANKFTKAHSEGLRWTKRNPDLAPHANRPGFVIPFSHGTNREIQRGRDLHAKSDKAFEKVMDRQLTWMGKESDRLYLDEAHRLRTRREGQVRYGAHRR